MKTPSLGWTGAVAAAVLIVSLLPAAAADPGSAGVPEAGADAPAARSGPPVVARTGNLTQRAAGLPAADTAASRQLASASVRQDLDAGRVSGTFVLRGTPGATSELNVTFGHWRSGQCDGHSEVNTDTTTVGTGFSRSGNRITLSLGAAPAGYQDWDCAFASLRVPGSTTDLYDVLGGSLTNVYGTADLRLTKVALLGRNSPALRLVPGVWTTVEVTVRNNGRWHAPGVRISSPTKNLKVRRGLLGQAYRGGQVTGRVQVKLVGKRQRTKVRLVARSGAVRTTATRQVIRTSPPRRPAAGRYRSADGSLTFRVTNGRIVGFKGARLRMTCQPPGAFATYRNVDLTFPRRVPVPRNGIVDAQIKYRKGNAWYDAGLRMRISGKRATQARFSYYTSGSCRVVEEFTGRRIGR